MVRLLKTWHIELFGGLRAVCDDRSVTHFRTLRCGLLLAILAIQPEHTHSREELGELLWPEEDPQRQRARLRGELYELHTGLGEDIFKKAGNLGIRLRPGVTSDVSRFDEAVRGARRDPTKQRQTPLLQAALDLYRGDFLPGYYDDWSVRERTRLKELQASVRAQLEQETVRGSIASKPDITLGVKTDVVLLCYRNNSSEVEVAIDLQRALQVAGLRVFWEREVKVGGIHRRGLDEVLCHARAVIPLVFTAALHSDLFRYNLEVALDCQRKDASLIILPVLVGQLDVADEEARETWELIDQLPKQMWTEPSDTMRVSEQLLAALQGPKFVQEGMLETVGGGIGPTSPFYVERRADPELQRLLENHQSIILVRGGRQIGKTSLLARGMLLARERGWRSMRTDFQKLSAASLANPSNFYRQLAMSLMRQCAFPYDFALLWEDILDPGQNFEYFLRDLLEAEPTSLIWSIDEADKLFSASFSTDFFGLVRSWHNDRAAEPGGPFSRLSIVIAYATEAHLFIHDLNQSPFNVGERVPLDDFTLEQVLHLNTLYGNPVKKQAEVAELQTLLGGQPYLTRRALDFLAREQGQISELLKKSLHEDGPFSDHLKRVYASVCALDEVAQYVRNLLLSNRTASLVSDAYFRLLRTGIVRQNSDGQVIFRCDLYRRYLAEHLL